MKILHTSDWHLGKRLENCSRLHEQEQAIGEIESVVISHGVDLIIVAGDIFDTAVPTAEAEKLFFESIISLSALAPLVVLSGNHDDPDRLAACARLAATSNVFIIGGLDNHEFSSSPIVSKAGLGYLSLQLRGETINLALLPYPQESRMSAIMRQSSEVSGGSDSSIDSENSDITSGAATEKPLVTDAMVATTAETIAVANMATNIVEIAATETNQVENNIATTNAVETDITTATNYTAKVSEWLSIACKGFVPGQINVLVSHLFMAGSVVSDERELGSAKILPTDIIPPTAMYTALGHIHKPYYVSKSRNIVYSGSLLTYSFDEINDKSVVVVDIDPSGVRSTVRVPLTTATPLKQLEVKNFDEAVAVLESNSNCYVSLIYCCAEPLSVSQTTQLKKFDCLTKLSFKSEIITKTPSYKRAEKSASELFKEFYRAKFKSDAPSEMIDMFLSISEGL